MVVGRIKALGAREEHFVARINQRVRVSKSAQPSLDFACSEGWGDGTVPLLREIRASFVGGAEFMCQLFQK